MKRGADNLSKIDNSQLEKKKTITKSLQDFLQEVNAGHYEDFHSFLIQNDITLLDFSFWGADKVDFTKLGQALQGTQIHTLNFSYNNIGADAAETLGHALHGTPVHTINLSWNSIGAEGAGRLGKALKGTQVITLNLYGNSIGDEGASALADCVCDTLLFEVITMDSFFCNRDFLDVALKENQWKKQLTPYCIASLQHIPEKEKTQYCETNFQFPATNDYDAELKYAAGIFISLGQFASSELQAKILSFLPGVNSTLVSQYQLATEQAARKRAICAQQSKPICPQKRS